MLDNKDYRSFCIIKRLIKDHVFPYRIRITLAVVFMVIVAICSASIVRMVEPAVNEVLIGHNQKMLIIVPVVIFFLHIVKGISEYFQSYYVKYVGQQILTDLQMKMYEHLLLSDVSFIQSQSSGKLISRFTNDIVLMRGAVSNMLIGCAKHLLSVLFLIGIMFWMDSFLATFVFIAFPVAIYPIQKIGRRMRHSVGEAQEELSNYTVKLDETFGSIKIVKSFSAEHIEVQRARRIIKDLLKFYRSTAKLDALTSPIMEILTGFAIACIIWYGCSVIISGQSSPGELFSFLTAFAAAYRPFKSLVALNVNIQEGLAAANRIFNILDHHPEIVNAPTASDIKFLKPAISFHDVSLIFRKKYALKNVSFNIEAGKTYALVGRSGSGKTSIANLLIRFFDTTEGFISIEGNNIKEEITIESLRSQIAFVTQDTILFDATVADNIAYGKSNVSRSDIIDAATAADAHEFIQSLPEGYETILGVQASTLSGGQRQRLSIARAFLKNAPILVLDEATSSLDPNSEQAILNALSRLRKNKTTLIITHRLSSIKDTDQIIVMKNGKIIEQGTHDQLIKNMKEYFLLYNKELKDEEETL